MNHQSHSTSRLIPLASMLCLTGCAGPGNLVNRSTLAHQDASVAWVYQAGWQIAGIGPPLPPMLLPIHNSVRALIVQDERVVVYEDSLGDFGSGKIFPVTTLDLKTGKVISRVNQLERPAELETMMKPVDAKISISVCDGYFLQIAQGGDLRIYLSNTRDAANATKIFERRGVGMVTGWLHLPDANCLLITALGRNELGLWDAISYVIRVNLNQLNFGKKAIPYSVAFWD